jgi:polysaccharide deacetylase family protein (PEP-CTERM system associated)
MVENILSVDVEDWFHICGEENRLPAASWSRLESRVVPNTIKILEILRRRGVLATFFVLGFVAQKHPDLIREIKRAGHEIASHGYAHQRVYTMTPETFRRDLSQASEILYKVTGSGVLGFRAPEWSIRDDSDWALEILQQQGFAYDSSRAPLPIIGNTGYAITPQRLALSEGYLWEFPPLVIPTRLINLPGGGGWGLRVFPYHLIRSALRKLNRRGQPGLIYLHPREFDSDNPRIQISLTKRFVIEARWERTERRLMRLLDDFRFTSVSDFLSRQNGKNIENSRSLA